MVPKQVLGLLKTQIPCVHQMPPLFADILNGNVLSKVREGAPDLAVEFISPGDTYAEVAEKVEAWLTAG